MVDRIEGERTNEAPTYTTKTPPEENMFNGWHVGNRFRDANGIREHRNISTCEFIRDLLNGGSAIKKNSISILYFLYTCNCDSFFCLCIPLRTNLKSAFDRGTKSYRTPMCTLEDTLFLQKPHIFANSRLGYPQKVYYVNIAHASTDIYQL